MSKVYVTQIPSKFINGQWVPNLNVSSAVEYGDVVVMFEPSHSHYYSITLFNEVAKAIENFDPEEDYLLPTGDPLLYTMVVAKLARKTNKFRILKWDRNVRRYSSHVIMT